MSSLAHPITSGTNPTSSTSMGHPVSPLSSATNSILFTNSTDEEPTLNKKKSRRIPPERRKKVAKACDVCKKRKQKCNELLPCEVCLLKNFSCVYTGIDRRNLKPSKKELENRRLQSQASTAKKTTNSQHIHSGGSSMDSDSSGIHQKHSSSNHKHKSDSSDSSKQSHTHPSGPPLDSVPTSTSQSSFLPSSLQPLFHFPLSIQPNEEEEEGFEKDCDMTLISEEEGLNSRLLYDTAGNLRYIGESSVGSFLPQCRTVFQKILGISRFTHDPQRFLMIDSPASRNMRIPVSLPPSDYASHLIQLFKKYINHVTYVFNEDYFEKKLIDTAFHNPLRAATKQMCLLYLILAIGSIYAKIEIQRKIFPFPLSYFVEPHVLFESAQNLLNTTLDDSSLWLVEAHLLMYFYGELNMTRNTAWMNLGIAIRYAQGLGMQRRYVNESFKDQEYALHRRKLFRSLYIVDRFCAIHLGRSLTINDIEWDDKNSLTHLNDLQNEMLKVSLLNGKVLTKVYHNPSIGMKIALKLATELKIYTMNSSISKSLSLENTLKYNDNHGLLLLHINHLHGITLLSRPFFLFIILIKLNFIKFDEKSRNYSNLKNFYQSCVKSSLLSIKLIEFYFVNNLHPLKSYTIISSSFNAGLMIGMILLLQSQSIDDDLFDSTSNINGGENSRVVCISAVNSAISILKHYGTVDPTAKRYFEILQNMMDSTKIQQQTYQEFASKQRSQTQQQSSRQPQPHQERDNLEQRMSQSEVGELAYPQYTQNLDINLSHLIPGTSDITPNAAQRFEDWLFPRMDNSQDMTSSSSRSHSHSHQNMIGFSPGSSGSDRYQADDFLKDLAGFNNMTTTNLGNQFLDDFLFDVVEGSAKNKQ